MANVGRAGQGDHDTVAVRESGEVDHDVARCHAKRYHVEHAGFRNTGRAVAASRPASALHREQRLDGGVVRLGSKSHRGGCHLCHIDCAGSNPGRTTLPHVEGQRRERGRRPRRGCGVLQETGARRQQIEQQSHAGPFVGPKPKSMMVPRGARRSDQKAHPSRLEQARRFLPSWPCEFDSRHPLQIIAPSWR
jgi:hypothetical protein